ncbi:MAG TPA: MlaD family protein [Syntrophales bacterium]|nr:MlaD family protein [Syntrophales bacterium]HQM28332.1 MlaD family protein [Syntrophales bacterium]
MTRRSSHLVIGLFTSIGIVIGAGVILWLGASKYFEKGDTYTTYFDESVQGLQVDSIVKYRGVDIGRVKQIRVAPDNRLIEVVLKIQLRGELEKTVVSELKTAGITGIVFVELDRMDPSEPSRSPQIDFPSEYPIIPSRPSEIRQILSGVDSIIEKINQIDFGAVSGRVESAARSAENFFGGPQMQSILVKLEAATVSLDSTIGKVDRAMADGKFEDVLGETKAALTEARLLIKTMRDELGEMKLARTAGKADRLVENLDRRTRALSIEIRTTGESLRRTSESLERLLDRLSNNPSDLFLSSPPSGGRGE